MQGQCSVGQGLPPLHEARCGLVFLTVASNLEAAPGSPQRQHGGGPLVVSCGQYVQRAANVCQWPGGREDGIRWLLWLPHLSHGRYMVSSGSCILPTCQMLQCESTGALWWTMSRTHTTLQDRDYVSLVEAYLGIQPDAWLPDSFFPASSCRIELCQSDAGHTSVATRGVDHATQIDKGVDQLQHVHLPPGLLSKAWMREPGVFWFLFCLTLSIYPTLLIFNQSYVATTGCDELTFCLVSIFIDTVKWVHWVWAKRYTPALTTTLRLRHPRNMSDVMSCRGELTLCLVDHVTHGYWVRDARCYFLSRMDKYTWYALFSDPHLNPINTNINRNTNPNPEPTNTNQPEP